MKESPLDDDASPLELHRSAAALYGTLQSAEDASGTSFPMHDMASAATALDGPPADSAQTHPADSAQTHPAQQQQQQQQRPSDVAAADLLLTDVQQMVRPHDQGRSVERTQYGTPCTPSEMQLSSGGVQRRDTARALPKTPPPAAHSSPFSRKLSGIKLPRVFFSRILRKQPETPDESEAKVRDAYTAAAELHNHQVPVLQNTAAEEEAKVAHQLSESPLQHSSLQSDAVDVDLQEPLQKALPPPPPQLECIDDGEVSVTQPVRSEDHSYPLTETTVVSVSHLRDHARSVHSSSQYTKHRHNTPRVAPPLTTTDTPLTNLSSPALSTEVAPSSSRPPPYSTATTSDYRSIVSPIPVRNGLASHSPPSGSPPPSLRQSTSVRRCPMTPTDASTGTSAPPSSPTPARVARTSSRSSITCTHASSFPRPSSPSPTVASAPPPSPTTARVARTSSRSSITCPHASSSARAPSPSPTVASAPPSSPTPARVARTSSRSSTTCPHAPSSSRPSSPSPTVASAPPPSPTPARVARTSSRSSIACPHASSSTRAPSPSPTVASAPPSSPTPARVARTSSRSSTACPHAPSSSRPSSPSPTATATDSTARFTAIAAATHSNLSLSAHASAPPRHPTRSVGDFTFIGEQPTSQVMVPDSVLPTCPLVSAPSLSTSTAPTYANVATTHTPVTPLKVPLKLSPTSTPAMHETPTLTPAAHETTQGNTSSPKPVVPLSDPSIHFETPVASADDQSLTQLLHHRELFAEQQRKQDDARVTKLRHNLSQALGPLPSPSVSDGLLKKAGYAMLVSQLDFSKREFSPESFLHALEFADIAKASSQKHLDSVVFLFENCELATLLEHLAVSTAPLCGVLVEFAGMMFTPAMNALEHLVIQLDCCLNPNFSREGINDRVRELARIVERNLHDLLSHSLSQFISTPAPKLIELYTYINEARHRRRELKPVVYTASPTYEASFVAEMCLPSRAPLRPTHFDSQLYTNQPALVVSVANSATPSIRRDFWLNSSPFSLHPRTSSYDPVIVNMVASLRLLLERVEGRIPERIYSSTPTREFCKLVCKAQEYVKALHALLAWVYDIDNEQDAALCRDVINSSGMLETALDLLIAARGSLPALNVIFSLFERVLPQEDDGTDSARIVHTSVAQRFIGKHLLLEHGTLLPRCIEFLNLPRQADLDLLVKVGPGHDEHRRVMRGQALQLADILVASQCLDSRSLNSVSKSRTLLQQVTQCEAKKRRKYSLPMRKIVCAAEKARAEARLEFQRHQLYEAQLREQAEEQHRLRLERQQQEQYYWTLQGSKLNTSHAMQERAQAEKDRQRLQTLRELERKRHVDMTNAHHGSQSNSMNPSRGVSKTSKPSHKLFPFF